MTRYLLGNLESRHILPDNDLRLERAKINDSRSIFFFWLSDYSHPVRSHPIISHVVSVACEILPQTNSEYIQREMEPGEQGAAFCEDHT